MPYFLPQGRLEQEAVWEAPLQAVGVAAMAGWVEAAVAANKTLTNHLHQYILFDFRVWSKSAFPVRIGNGFGTVGARVGSVCVCCLSVADR